MMRKEEMDIPIQMAIDSNSGLCYIYERVELPNNDWYLKDVGRACDPNRFSDPVPYTRTKI
jgi:hypothetical protein